MAGAGAEPLAVRVTPRSSRNQVLGLRDGVVAIKLQAPPVDGAANAPCWPMWPNGWECPAAM